MRRILKSAFERMLNSILDVADYYIYEKRVSLSEALLLLLIVSRLIRTTFFGTQGSVMANVFTDPIWLVIFGALAFVHLVALMIRSRWPRIIVAFIHVILWGFLAVLGVMSYAALPGAGDFIIFAIVAAFLTVRMYDEIDND